ncbi:MAG: formate dehydrogenase subunit gamma [Pseudomonadota bacterium]
MARFLILLTLIFGFLSPAAMAQEGDNPRASTGGAQTLEDILARQRGEEVPSRDRHGAAAQGAQLLGQLGTRGAVSDSEVWTALRFNRADVTVSTNNPVDAVLVQDSGMRWYEFRAGPLKVYGGYLLLGTLVALVLFYLIRGRIRIDSGKSGITIERFKPVERFGHWLLAGSFILLGITGLITLFGRVAIIPLFGKEAFAPIALASKWVHNNVAWPFMLALILVFVFWVLHNIPNRHDLKWMAKGGGLFSKGVHPPARKFNAGQKLIFWSVILLGGSISLSGLSLLFPFELPMFAKTFAVMNDIGIGPLFNGGEPLATTLAPHAEMQLASLWHASVSFVLIAIVLAHIYLGSVGMEGAYDAMGSGQVDINWAEEHHGLWVEEERAKGTAPARTPSAAHPAE